MKRPVTAMPQKPEWATTMLWLLMLLPVLYLFSFGPVLALVEQSGNRSVRDGVAVLYEPVGWLHDPTILKRPLEGYNRVCGGGRPCAKLN
jgi:hypothetical protein